MKKQLSLALLFCLSLLNSFVYAGKEKMNSRINSAQIAVGNLVAVSDNKYPNINLSGSAVVVNSTGKITLALDNYAGTLNTFATPVFYLKVGINVAYEVTAGGGTQFQTVELVIDHNANGVSVDKSISVIKNAHVIAATIAYFKDMTNNIIVSPFIPSNLYLETEIETDRYYTLNPSNVSGVNHFFDATTNELQVYWNTVAGAEEYELEWTYVNDFDITSTAYEYQSLSVTPAVISLLNPVNIDFSFSNNATRIRTTQNTFRIGLNYDQGLIVYRLRAIGRNIANNSFEVIGDWTLNQPQTTPSFKISNLGTFNDYFVIANGHEDNKNWQYTATYAEEGKKKEVVGYFDGSLRKRQTVTKTNSENIAIVGETVYDSQGRPAVQILPSPANNYSPLLKFYENFNQSNNQPIISGVHVPYNRIDFENPSFCPYTPSPLFTGNIASAADGAAVYYSPNNQNKENQQAYLPNSQQYPFTSMIYTPDNTGRVRYQGGVGPDNKIGSTHETKYVYGDPDQEDLDKLFGSEAGFAERFKKNMIIDPNGQISVSYLNTEDKVVATALAGNSPMNVNPLNSTVLQNKNVSYMDYNDANYNVVNYVDNGTVVFKKKIIPDVTGPYSFEYDLILPQFTDNCIPGFCYDCVYDLAITINDECNTPIYSTVTPVGFNVGDTVDYTCGSPMSFSSINFSPPFTAVLTAGKEYFLTKTLTVDNKALGDYLIHYINKANNICVQDLTDFNNTELANVDLSGCHITCAACSTKVESYYLLHNDPTKIDTNNVNYDPNYIYMSPGQKQLAIDQCQAPCNPATLCQVEFDNMLQDMKPKGQYGQYDVSTLGVYDASLYELSIFNTVSSNYLRLNTIKSTVTNPNEVAGTPFVTYDIKFANWQNPEFYNKSNHNFSSPAIGYTKDHYFDADGSISKVRLVASGANYIPAVNFTGPLWIFTDNIGDWTYPENLTNMKDFIIAYSNNSNWSYSLVKFHPEFNYFLDCDRQSNPVYGIVYCANNYTSEQFDTDLRLTSTFAQATSPFVSCTKNWSVLNSNAVSGGDLIDYDPYFNGAGPGVGPMYAAMVSRLSNYQGSGKSAKQLAAEMYSTGNMYYCNCAGTFGATSVNCCLSNFVIPTASLDQEWTSYREMYLAEKQKLILEEAHKAACQTYAVNPDRNNYYNGAIGDPNFAPFTSYVSYNFWPFIPFNFPNWTYIYIFNPASWPNYAIPPASFMGAPQTFVPAAANKSIFQPSSFVSNTGRGYYDFGCPSSYYHKNRYSKKIRRVPDLQTLSNILAGGATSAADIGEALTKTADDDIYFTTGQCPIFKRLELFLSTVAKKTTLFNFNNINPLVSEPAFTKDIYDAIISCASLPPATWVPLGFKPVPFGVNNIKIEFYDITGTPVHLLGADMILDGTNIPSWGNVVSFSNISYNGVVAGQSAFTLKALYNPGVSQPFVQYQVAGTTCIPSNCSPPASQQCKPTEQAYEIQNFLSAVLTDNPPLNSPVNLGDPATNSAQFYTSLLKYPFDVPVSYLPNPIANKVFLDVAYTQIRIEGPSSCDVNGLKVYFNFVPVAPITNLNLNGAIGFTGITPIQGAGPYDFTIKALYPSNQSQIFQVTVSYSGTGCQQYVLSNCQPYVPTQCDNNNYNTTVQLQAVLNEIAAGMTSFNYVTNTPYPVSGLSNYSPLLQSQIGSAVNFQIKFVNSVAGPPYTHFFTVDFMSDNSTLCSIQTTFSSNSIINPFTSITFNDITILNSPSNQFLITATDGFNEYALTGTATCLQMQNCEPCDNSTIIFKENFEKYTVSTPVSGTTGFRFTNDYLKFPNTLPTQTVAGNYSGFDVCPANLGDYTIIFANIAGCRGYGNHTPGGEKYLDFNVNHGINPPATDFSEIWKYKDSSTNSSYLTVTLGSKYDISCYFRSQSGPIQQAYIVSLIVNDGTNDFVIATYTVNGGFPPLWRQLQGTWSATSNQMGIRVKATRYIFSNQGISYITNNISLDDILVKEQKCENESVYSLPPATPEDDCVNQLTNIALSNAQQKYTLYIDNIKKDFTNRYNLKCYQSLEKLTAQYTSREGHYTLYYYDQGGNLIKTIPPEGVEPINLTAIEPISGSPYGTLIKQDRLNKTHTVFTNHRLATKYEYNSLNQLIKQHVPDHDNTDLWSTQNNPSLPANTQAKGMDFSDNSRGYIAGTDGSNGVLYITTNGGNSWSPATSLGLGDVIDIDVTGTTAFAILSDGSILKTPNWTAPNPTWQTIILPGSNLMQFTDINFKTPTLGYITGNNGLLLETTDGGVTWNNIVLGTLANLNKIKFKIFGFGYYGIIVGDGGTVFYNTPSNSTWQTYNLINNQIDIKNVEIIDVTSFMDVMLTAIDKNATPNKGTAITVNDVDNIATTLVTSVFSVLSYLPSSLNSITFNTYITGPNTFVDAFVGGAINGVTPVMYKLQSVNTGAYVPTTISVVPATNNSVNDLKINGFGNSVYTVYGGMSNGQFLYLPSGFVTTSALNLTTIGPNINAAKLNNIWQDPSGNTGLIAGNGGTIIRFTVNPGPSVASSALNAITFPPLNAVTAAKDGSGKVYAMGNAGSVIYSSNFGASWVSLNTGLGAGIDLYSGLYLPSVTPTVVIGGSTGYVGQINATTNLLAAINNPANAKQYNSITRNPNNLNEIFLAGKNNTNDALIEKYTLNNVGTPNSVFSSASQKTINKLVFPVSTTAFAVGDQGTLLQSTNSGNSFTGLTPLGSNNLEDIVFSDQVIGYILGSNNTVYKTSDGGTSWILKPAPAGSNINAVYSFGSGKLLATGTGAPNLFNISDQSNIYSTRFFYDALGRLVISQNVKQFNKPLKAYGYNNFDALGRIIETGEIAGAAMQDPETLTGPNGVIDINVYNTWIGTGNKTEVTFTSYDEPVTNPCAFVQDNLRKRVSATYLDSDGNLLNGYLHATYYTYDIHGNVSSLMQENPAMPIGHTCKRVDYQYDLISGKVNQIDYQAGHLDSYSHKYDYDADNRITNVYTSKDGFNWQQDAKYFYYLHGPLARTELGNDKVQGMDYVYTLQGWIKGVNSTILNENNDAGKDGAGGTLYNSTQANLNKHISKDAASYSLNYFNNDYIAIDASKNTATNRFDADVSANLFASNSNNWLYNGNISAMVSTINEYAGPGSPKPQLTGYKYDQLNRVNTMFAYRNITGNAWDGTPGANEYRNEFVYDANGNIQQQDRYDNVGTKVDGMTYQYHTDGSNKKHSNRLYHVNDNIGAGVAVGDIDDQGVFTPAPPSGNSLGAINTANNYGYDEIGNLVRDNQEEIANIDWTLYGKIKTITRTGISTKFNDVFEYDAAGNRVSKTSFTNSQPVNQRETIYYVRDASGNVMATYDYKPVAGPQKLFFIEHSVYGSSRAGMQTYLETNNLDPNSPYSTAGNIYTVTVKTGLKYYELNNHLSNVLTVVSDKKVAVESPPSSGIVGYYNADIISANDYYPFGMVMPGRKYNTPNYRYGFNGKENDNEVKGDGNSQDYGMRINDSRLGRFLSMDPISAKYPFLSTYQFASNSPIMGIDEDGGELKFYTLNWETSKDGKTHLSINQEKFTNDIAFNVSIKLGIGSDKTEIAKFSVNYSDIGLSAFVVGHNGVWTVLPEDFDPHNLPPENNVIWDSFETLEEYQQRVQGSAEKVVMGLTLLSGHSKEGMINGLKKDLTKLKISSTEFKNIVKSSKSLIKSAGLPHSGKIRFIPRASDIKSGKLLKKDGGFVDKFGNIWKKPKGNNMQGDVHWDVQLSKKGKSMLGKYSNSGNHINVSGKGKIAH